MHVLSATQGADMAGTSYGLMQAFRGHPTITLRSAVRRSNYLTYPHDLPWRDIAEQWRQADVIHTHNSAKTLRLMANTKPFVLHHHGTMYRKHHEVYDAYVSDNGGVGVASTLDLLKFGNATWVPQPHDTPMLAKHRQLRTNDRLRVAHAPTNRAIKGTETFLAACKKLNVEPVLIERKTWAECLAIKGTCDVLYDQVQLGYGSNAIEAWAMGIPVIAGADDWTLDRMRQEFRTLPFVEATADTIADALALMLDDAERERYSRRGIRHVNRWHNGRETVARLEGIYHTLAP